MSEIKVNDGKYTFIKTDSDYRVHCLRYDEEWMIFSQGHHAISSLLYEYEQLQAENEKLKEFARSIIKEVCWGYEEFPDGGNTQGLAEKLGLIESFVAGENDVNPEFDDFAVGDTIYRFTDILKETKQ